LDYRIAEDDELTKLKDWWKNNGVAFVTGIVIALGIVVGKYMWDDHVRKRAEEASSIYETMMVERQSGNIGAAQAAGARLVEQYDATPYAAKAALFLARVSFDKGDLTSTAAQLRRAMDMAGDPATKHAARLRLARVLLQQGKGQEALALLATVDTDAAAGGFASHYHETRADILVSLGKPGDARAEYDRALATLPAGSPYVTILKMKRDDLGQPEAAK